MITGTLNAGEIAVMTIEGSWFVTVPLVLRRLLALNYPATVENLSRCEDWAHRVMRAK